MATVEFGIEAVVSSPERWRIVEQPGIRRHIFRRFPYVLYYRWEPARERITVFAVMHSSRKPNYWKYRVR